MFNKTVTTSNLGTLLVLCTTLMSSVETGASDLVEHRRAEQIHKQQTHNSTATELLPLFQLSTQHWPDVNKSSCLCCSFILGSLQLHTHHTHTSTFTALIN